MNLTPTIEQIKLSNKPKGSSRRYSPRKNEIRILPSHSCDCLEGIF